MAFWNVENLFDTQDDSTRNDDDFTPAGKNNWTAKRYKTKQQNLCKTIIAMGSTSQKGSKLEMPLAIGLAEVENGKVLRDLCNGTPLRKFKYKYIHYDSPDKRGIDNALLY
ncbi:MAG: endonuclease/exonuclease/phosphatase family protein, partial [Bacteroidales bacterium]|nr:endonuclease/exonuclease/phosphatase family protein [Bacteroidales bacterium]